MIPEAAVEAAALALYERHYGVTDWGIVSGGTRARYWEEATTALEAAAPHMQAAAVHMLAPALALADEWDAVAEVFPRSAAGIFAKSHANRLRETLPTP